MDIAPAPHSKWARAIRSCGLIVGACSAFLVVAVFLPVWSCEPPSLTTLAERFSSEQADLEMILAMAEHDGNLIRIDPAWLMTKNFQQFQEATPETGISAKRWDKYRELFKRNSITQGIQRDPQTQDAFILVKSFGLLNRGFSSGYLHCGPGPDHFYRPCSSSQSTGSHQFTRGDQAYSFVKLPRGWYAYSQGPG